MIKILKEGKLPKITKVIYKATCPRCGCKFEFEIEDCKKLERKLDGLMTIECPYCHTEIIQRHFENKIVEEEDNE